MAGLVLIVAIALLITSASTPQNKKIVSGVTAILLFAAIGLFLVLTVWIAYKVPSQAPEVIGQAAGYVIFLIFFAAIGAGIRRLRLSKRQKEAK